MMVNNIQIDCLIARPVALDKFAQKPSVVPVDCCLRDATPLTNPKSLRTTKGTSYE